MRIPLSSCLILFCPLVAPASPPVVRQVLPGPLTKHGREIAPDQQHVVEVVDRRRVSDKAVLHMIKLWLIAPVEEKDAKGQLHRTTRNMEVRTGQPTRGSDFTLAQRMCTCVVLFWAGRRWDTSGSFTLGS